MSPPGFIRSLLPSAEGTDPPYCSVCVHIALLWGSAELACMKYGAHVFLHSSCASHERRQGSGSPVVRREDIKARFGEEMADLRGSGVGQMAGR